MATNNLQNLENTISIALWEAPLLENSTAKIWGKVQTTILKQQYGHTKRTLKLNPLFLSMITLTVLLLVGIGLMTPGNVWARIAQFFLPGVGLVSEGSENYVLTDPVTKTEDGFVYSLTNFVSSDTKTWAKLRVEGIEREEFESLAQSSYFDLPFVILGNSNRLDCTYWEAYFNNGLIIECQFPALKDQNEPFELVLPTWPAPFLQKEMKLPINLRVATSEDMVVESDSPTTSETYQGISMSLLQVNHTMESTVFVLHFDAPSLDEVVLPESLYNLRIEEANGFAVEILDIETVFPNTGRTILIKTRPVAPSTDLRFSLDSIALMHSAPGQLGTKIFSMTIRDTDLVGANIPIGEIETVSDVELKFESARLEKGVDSEYKLIFDVATSQSVTHLMLRCDHPLCISASTLGEKLLTPGILHPSISLSTLPEDEFAVYLTSLTREISGSWNINWHNSEDLIEENLEKGTDTAVYSSPLQLPVETMDQNLIPLTDVDKDLVFVVKGLLKEGFTTAYGQPGWVHFSHEQIESEDNAYYQSGRVFGDRHSITEWWVLLEEDLKIEKRISISKSADGKVILEEVQIGTDVYNKTLELKSEVPGFSLIPRPESLDLDIQRLSELDYATIESVEHNGRPTQKVTLEYRYSQPTNWGNVLEPIVKITQVNLIDDQTGTIVQRVTSVTFVDGNSLTIFTDNYGIPSPVKELSPEANDLLDLIEERIRTETR
ncbi:MAG: hypothetical protein WBI14_08710 [Anaerolineaceae bacterium]